MQNDNALKNESYKLFPVGTLRVGERSTLAYIMPDYRPALKYLELFSHVAIFLRGNKVYNFSDYPDKLQSIVEESFRATDLLRKSDVGVIVAKVASVNEKKGLIELDYTGFQDGAVIFDIKPYFPCEDRIKDFRVPDFMKGWPEWRPDEGIICTNVSDIADIFIDSKPDDHYSLHRIGHIRKREGDYLIEFIDSDTDFFHHMEQFSHLKILWWFNRFDKNMYRKATLCDPPYENAPRTGVFASRSPVRPNPIAMTTVRILSIDVQNRQIKVSGLDAFDKTPVIDIIPYIPALDRVREYRVPGWLKHWPEWLDDREPEIGPGTIKTEDSGIDRIHEYTVIGETDAETVVSPFEENIQSFDTYLNEIVVRGARQNNLKNINFSIPKNKMTVVTGVSGSGKSSLAFDTVYAESQRRFMDNMSASGRTLFEQMEKPDFDQITGLPPAIVIEQKNIGRNPRSTVGTMTDIYDYLRLLFSKIGTRHCPECGRAITPLKAEEITGLLVALKQGIVFNIRAFNAEEIFEEFIAPAQEIREKDLYVKKLKECVNRSLSQGNGAIIVNINQTAEFLFQTREMCYHCNRIFFELTTSTFSFNNPESMCPVCKGLGVKLDVDTGLIVSNPDLSVLDGASKWWGDLRKFRQKSNANWMKGEILALAESMGINLELPWKELPESFKKQALYGSDGREVRFSYENTNGRRGEIVKPVEGAYNTILRLFRENSGDSANRIVTAFMREKPCNCCHGERLVTEGRLVSIAKTRFPETVIMTIEELKKWINDLPPKLTKAQFKISFQMLKELNKRLENLMEAGVSYLAFDSAIPTLSGGELQRLRLASQLGSGITNILYVLDEPSTGLHPKDHNRLIKVIRRIRDEGNTVLVVEHDADTMLAADKIIDIGPGAGVHGGMIVAEGTPEEIMRNPHSATGKYLADITNGKPLIMRNRKKPCGWIKVKGARCNNLKNIDAAFPLGVLTCISGVSGSGKSSLVSKTLYPALTKFSNCSDEVPGDYDRIEGLEAIDKIINISQHSIGRTPRSNPATYTGVFDDIRYLFTITEEAKKRGYKQNRFSFNSKEGQCEVCGGEGRKYVEMHFMPDIWVECSVCGGKRFNAETLEIKYNQKSMADVLDMNIEEALDFFKGNPKIAIALQTLYDVGLGYIKLGQSALTLSGGEAQRIKLAKELSKADTGKTLYLLDEPTTGLHFSDVQNLLNILHRIVKAGNTVIVIEHNPEIMKNADWIIDMGPEGGAGGGYIIAQGTPEEVAKVENSYTGNILKELLG